MDLIINYDGELGLFLYLTSIVCSLCYSLSLFYKKGQNLAAIMLLFWVSMLLCFIYDRYLVTDKQEIIRTIDLTTTAFGGVFILTYFVSPMHPRKLTSRYFVFYISVVSVFSLLILTADIMLDNPPLGIEDAFKNAGRPSVIVCFVGQICVIFWECYIAYIVISMYICHRKFIRRYYSYEEQINLRWVGWCIALFGIFAFVILLRIFNTGVPMKIIFNIVAISTITCIYVLGFRQGAIPTVDDLTNMLEKKEEIFEKEDTICSNKQQERQRRIESKLKLYFAEQKPYLNSELSLLDVATAIEVNTNYLSRLINRQLNTNFSPS